MKKPAGRLERRYRIIWDQNHPYESMYNSPMAPETVEAAAISKVPPWTPCVEGIGPDAGYVCAFPSQKHAWNTWSSATRVALPSAT